MRIGVTVAVDETKVEVGITVDVGTGAVSEGNPVAIGGTRVGAGVAAINVGVLVAWQPQARKDTTTHTTSKR
jgi:hypothetical protein